jgi:hypothetical protein
VTRRQRAAERLANGSAALGHRLWDRACAWCVRGRREDLSGWRGVLGVFVRVGLLLFGVYVLARIVRAVPALMWALAGWWMVAAWRAGRAPAERADGLPAEPPAVTSRAVVSYWLDALTRGRSGIHLGELHQNLTRHPDLAALKRAEVRAWLDRHRITVDRTLRVDGVPGRSGVSRTTIEALLKALPPPPESSPENPPLSAVDLHKSPHSPPDSTAGERPGEDHFDDVVQLFG